MPGKDRVVDSVAVVTNNESGFVSALAVSQFNDSIDVQVIYTGENNHTDSIVTGTDKLLQVVTATLGVGIDSLTENSDSLFTYGTQFKQWNGRTYTHPFDVTYLFNPLELAAKEYEYATTKHSRWLYGTNTQTTPAQTLAERGKAPITSFEDALFFNTDIDFGYNISRQDFIDYLRDECYDRNINVVDDEIQDVVTTGDTIESIRGEKTTYAYDVYIDCTGQQREIASHQNRTTTSLPFSIDTVHTYRRDQSPETATPLQTVTPANNGWFFTRDISFSQEVGYACGTDHTTLSETRNVFAEEFNIQNTDEITTREIPQAYLTDPWLENCLAIGDAAGITEPLHSIRSRLICDTALLFSNILSSSKHRNEEILQRKYNQYHNSMWENITEFISVYYHFTEFASEFWESGSKELPQNTEELHGIYNQLGMIPNKTILSQNEEAIFTVNDFMYTFNQLGINSQFYDRFNTDENTVTSPPVDLAAKTGHLDIEEFYNVHMQHATRQEYNN